MYENMFNGLFGKIGSGMCKLSMNGKIAVKTSNGYKAFDVATKKLTNCDNFVMPIGDDFFFCVPTNKVAIGDIILVQGKPRCVIEPGKETIKVLNYETSTQEELVPERHIFMGNTYLYGKIVSLFGKNATNGNAMMKYMMMSQLMGGKSDGKADMNSLLPMMMLMGGKGMEGMFDFDGLFDSDEAENQLNLDSLFGDENKETK